MNKFWFFLFRTYFYFRAKLKKKEKIYYQKLVEKECKSYTPPLRVNGPTFVTKQTILGKNVSFNGMKITGKGNLNIGDNFHSGTECKIITQIHNYQGTALPYDEKIITKDTFIGNNVWLGDNVIILGGVTIGEGVIIQAGSVVVSNIPDYAIAGGHPARVFKFRDIEHYMILNKEEKYH